MPVIRGGGKDRRLAYLGERGKKWKLRSSALPVSPGEPPLLSGRREKGEDRNFSPRQRRERKGGDTPDVRRPFISSTFSCKKGGGKTLLLRKKKGKRGTREALKKGTTQTGGLALFSITTTHNYGRGGEKDRASRKKSDYLESKAVTSLALPVPEGKETTTSSVKEEGGEKERTWATR